MMHAKAASAATRVGNWTFAAAAVLALWAPDWAGKPHPKGPHGHGDGRVYFDCTRPLMSEEEAARPWRPPAKRDARAS